MKRYNPKDIEPKWQQKWADDKIYQASDDLGDSSKPKKYILEYFPYPSGAAMHVGHVRNYTIGDVIARHARMKGFDVLHPMGWDAFGLPAENYAIKTGISPQQAIAENTARFKKQLMQMGFGHDWSREFASSDPDYYKWTQWFFLLLHKRGLAYQKESLQWWCPIDKTVLANEQVENGKCWRCGSEVEKKSLKQWFFKITDYADRLAKDLDDVNWTDGIKNMQRNWIGRSKGAEIDFNVEGGDQVIKVFTTRPDTLYGASFMVLAPEHPLVHELTTLEHREHVGNYLKEAQTKSDVERQETNREKTGVFTGAYAVNPINDQRLPVWVADFALANYGTGALFADACDDRDFEFAQKFGIKLTPTVVPDDPSEAEKVMNLEYAYTGKEGTLVNSGPYTGLRTAEAHGRIMADLTAKGAGKDTVNYKIRDWLISRQRYWGAPIPMIHCEKDGIVPVPEDQLPVALPDMESYEPSGDGRSPLARVPEWVNVACPQCGGPAQRETDTMDGFACSSWYFLRFADPHNAEKPFDTEKIKHWLPVDDYIGGAEHAVMHLLYARMWTKVMQDEGLIDFGEPFKTLRNQGMILAPDGNKMSKSKGNTIEPDGLIEQGYGADTIRIMELFIGPWNQSAAWSVEGMGGSFRFLQRVWALAQDVVSHSGDDQTDATEIKRIVHRTAKKVSDDLESLSFNTAIAAMMQAVNDLYVQKTKVPFDQAPGTWRWAVETLSKLLAPFAPHVAEELWQEFAHDSSIHLSEWPTHDDQYLVSDTMAIAVQVNGKLRGTIEVATDATEDQVVEAAKQQEKVATYLAGNDLKKAIYVAGKLVSFVI